MARYDYTSGWGIEEKFNWLIENISARDWLGKSGTTLLDELREEGFIVNRPVFYEARRQALDIYTPSEQIRALGPDDLFPEGYKELNLEFDQTRQYMYQFQITGYDAEARRYNTKFYSISTDEQLTRGEAEGALYEAIAGDQDFYAFRPENVSIYRVYTKG